MTRPIKRRPTARLNSYEDTNPDWRRVFDPDPGVELRRSDPRSREASTFWRATGVVTAESDAPWAMKSRVRSAVIAISVLVPIGIWFATGRAAQAGRDVEAWFIGVLGGPLLLLALIMVFLPRLGTAIIELLALIVGLRPRMSRPGFGGGYGGRQLTLVTDGTPGLYVGFDERLGEEVLVATTRRIPQGSVIHVWGPRIAGVRHAWVLRQENMRGIILARGLVGMAVIALICGYADVWMLTNGVSR